MTTEEIDLENKKLDLEREKIALERRKSVHNLIQIIFGSLALGCVSLFFNWEKFRSDDSKGQRDFLTQHIKVFEEPDPGKRIAAIKRLMTFRDRGLDSLEDELKQSELDLKAQENAKAAEEVRIKAEKEAQLAVEAKAKEEAQRKLREAMQKEAEARAREADRIEKARERSDHSMRDLGGGRNR